MGGCYSNSLRSKVHYAISSEACPFLSLILHGKNITSLVRWQILLIKTIRPTQWMARMTVS